MNTVYCHDTEIIEYDDTDTNSKLKSVAIIGDSILNNINPRGISKEGNVKVKSFPGSTSEDMKDFINPTFRLQPDAIILHKGTNNSNNGVDTSNMQNIVACIKKKSRH